MQTTDYDKQAESFLTKHGIKFACKLSDTKKPEWWESGKCGHHYRITLSKASNRITFDFFGSIHDREHGVRYVSAYCVLSCLSGDVTCPETFEEFCAEYGYNADSIKALATFKSCVKLAVKLRGFFTDDELRDLSEIQ